MSKAIELAKQEAASEQTNADKAIVMLQTMEITTGDDNEFAAEILRDIKAKHKALEGKRTSITKPMNAALREVNNLFRPVKERLEEGERILKGKIAKYLEAQEAENVALLSSVGISETPEEATAALATIEDVKAPKGVSVRYKWRAEVFSPDIVPDELRMPDLQKIQAYTEIAVRDHGEPTPIPGVRFVKEAIVTSRSS